MSTYTPLRRDLKIVRTQNGYEVHDKFGFFDGPYKTFSDAAAAIKSQPLN